MELWSLAFDHMICMFIVCYNCKQICVSEFIPCLYMVMYSIIYFLSLHTYTFQNFNPLYTSPEVKYDNIAFGKE